MGCLSKYLGQWWHRGWRTEFVQNTTWLLWWSCSVQGDSEGPGPLWKRGVMFKNFICIPTLCSVTVRCYYRPQNTEILWFVTSSVNMYFAVANSLMCCYNSCIHCCFLQTPRGADLRQRALWMPRRHLWPGDEGEGCPGFRECFSYCYVWVPYLSIFLTQENSSSCDS